MNIKCNSWSHQDTCHELTQLTIQPVYYKEDMAFCTCERWTIQYKKWKRWKKKKKKMALEGYGFKGMVFLLMGISKWHNKTKGFWVSWHYAAVEQCWNDLYNCTQ